MTQEPASLEIPNLRVEKMVMIQVKSRVVTEPEPSALATESKDPRLPGALLYLSMKCHLFLKDESLEIIYL